MAQPFAGLILVFLIWLLFPSSEDSSQFSVISDLVASRLGRYKTAIDVLSQTDWGDFAPRTSGNDGHDTLAYVNLTGFRQEDGLAWEDLALFREKALQISRAALPSKQGQQLWDIARREAFWANASGTLHGSWTRHVGSVSRAFNSYNLSQSVPSVEWTGDQNAWARNITGATGKIKIRLESNERLTKHDGNSDATTTLPESFVRSMKAVAVLEDTTGTGLSWDMKLYGVHWPRHGVILLTTTSEKFEGIFALPHLTPDAELFDSSQQFLNQSLHDEVAKKRQNILVDKRMPWSSEVDNPQFTTHPSPHCEYIIYAQVHSPFPLASNQESWLVDHELEGEARQQLVHAIESELQNPRGAPIHSIPKLQMSAVIYSPDCAFFLETEGPPDYPLSEGNHLVGTKAEVHVHQVKIWMLVYVGVLLAQIHVLRVQMKESLTPSTLGRVSFWTISVMVIADGMTFAATAAWVPSVASTFLPTMALMFMSFLSMTIGGSFLAKIHEVQLPERRGRVEQSRESMNPSPMSSDLTVSSLPLPVTADRTTGMLDRPFIIPSDQDIGAEIAEVASAVPRAAPAQSTPQQFASFQGLVGRFVIFSLCTSFLLSSSAWYPRIRHFFLNSFAFAYMSFWLPQIYRNTVRNCRRALDWRFVVGQSLSRLLPIAYFWIKEDNFLYAQTDSCFFKLLCLWVLLQGGALAWQEVVGPRYGMPARWMPEAWDYHPILREDNIEAGGLLIGLVASEGRVGIRRGSIAEKRGSFSTSTGSSMRAIDCAICREVLEVPVLKSCEEDSSMAGVFARRSYMMTPCRHIFHTICLEGWMRFRLQCPICRDNLPPV